MKFHLVDTSPVFVDSTHVKACANSKKMRKRIASQEALWYEEELKKEINEDRKNHGKKPLKEKKDDSFRGSIGAIYQTFGGEEVYPTLEEKAANLLYFLTKNHSFSDGNKRIAAALFLYFLDRNQALFPNGKKRIGDYALAALTIMIAESKPEEKDMMVKVVMNCLAGSAD
ncbi:Fic family protein [Mediterraneibacter glycyrrhizinilyticus]|nr:Fic family protein [Mediterraneibacter glycyrrhizinilyticus]